MHKPPSNKTSSTANIGIAPTRERHLHNGGVMTEPAERSSNGKVISSRYRAVWECTLDIYRDSNLISKAEYRAGLRFRRAYYGAIMTRRYDYLPTSDEEATMSITKHDKLLDEAYATLSPDEIGAVVDVCGFSEHVWNPRAFEKLRKGLDHLAVQWNMAAVEVCGL